MLVDVATKHGVLTFMDGYSGYNQIFMVVEDVHETMFRCLRAFGYMKG